MQTAIITAGTNSSTVNIAVIDDDIVEEDETFTMNLNVPMLPGIIAGTITGAVATTVDTNSMLRVGGRVIVINLVTVLVVRVRFTQNQFTGSEATGFVLVNLELVGGRSASPFDVTVTPSEQSSVSAEGNIVCIIMC